MHERKRVRQLGFTLIELLIVVAIIGILSAVAVPNLLHAMQRSRQKRTVADIRQIALAWETFETEYGGYTAAGYSPLAIELETADLQDALEPTYLRVVPIRDGWGEPFHFSVDELGRNGTRYQIISYARDAQPQEGVIGPTTNFDADIVFENGSFVTFPSNM